MAISKIKRYSKSSNVTSSWIELIKQYEGQDSTETLAKQKLQVITTHKLIKKSYGRTELYIDKFETALQDLEDIQTPYDPIMAKIDLLNNITYEAQKITSKTISMNDNKNYANCLNEIRRQSFEVEDERAH